MSVCGFTCSESQRNVSSFATAVSSAKDQPGISGNSLKALCREFTTDEEIVSYPSSRLAVQIYRCRSSQPLPLLDPRAQSASRNTSLHVPFVLAFLRERRTSVEGGSSDG